MAWTTPHTFVDGETPPAASWNAWLSANLAFLRGDTAWQAPTLLNGATAFGGAQAAGYRIAGDMVFLRGAVILGAAGVGNPIWSLPAGYRPVANSLFAVVANSAFGVCTVTAAGDVKATVGTNSQYFTLDGIVFAVN